MLLESHAPQATDTRVLFVNTRDGLGADVAVHLLLARHLARAGVGVNFSINRHAADAQLMLEQLQGAGVEVVCPALGRPAIGRTALARFSALIQNTWAVDGLVQLARFIQARRVDILHATDRPRDALFCTLLGHLTRRPTVIHMHSNYYPSMSRLSRWAFRHCTCVLSVSEFTRRSMQAAGVPPERSAAILNAVDAEYFDPDRAPRSHVREHWNVPVDVPLIGLVGRLIPYKGHEDLLDALAAREELATAHVLVVGDCTGAQSAYADSLRTRAVSLGIADRVRFTGWQDVLPIYQALDVLAVPSWEEPFGLVVTEALAMRVPVVAYRSGGIPEIVRSGVEGLLVTPRAVDELADALVALVSQPGPRARLGYAGRERVLSQFTPARQAAEVAALYRRLVGNQRGAIRDVAPAAG